VPAKYKEKISRRREKERKGMRRKEEIREQRI
jgi:hypothetical protein